MSSARRVSISTSTFPVAEIVGIWLLTSAAIFGFAVKDFTHAGLAAVVLGLINALLRPAFSYFFMPVTALSYTLGMFLVNAGLLYTASIITPGLWITGLVPAVLGSVMITTIGSAMDALVAQRPLVFTRTRF